MKIDALVDSIYELVKPVADELDYGIYHIEYVKENGEYYLRIYIENEEGIKLSDCEALSRRVSDILDEKDPIEAAYFLEVSSPGLNRRLFKDEHFEKYIGRDVLVRFTKSLSGRKNIQGVLKAVDSDSITVEGEETIKVPKDKIKSANIDGEI